MNRRPVIKEPSPVSRRQGNRGVQQGWAGAKPVPLPGMVSSKVQKIMKKVPPQQLRKALDHAVNGTLGTTSGLGAVGGVASIIVPQLLDEVARVVPGRRTDASSIASTIGMIGGLIPGGQWLPLIGSLSGPILDILIAAIEASAKNNVVPGTMSVSADLKDYAAYVSQPGNETVTYDEWKKYLEDKNLQDKAKCVPITKAMLGKLSLEDFLKQEDIPVEAPAATKKADPNATRQPTEEEKKALENARLG